MVVNHGQYWSIDGESMDNATAGSHGLMSIFIKPTIMGVATFRWIWLTGSVSFSVELVGGSWTPVDWIVFVVVAVDLLLLLFKLSILLLLSFFQQINDFVLSFLWTIMTQLWCLHVQILYICFYVLNGLSVVSTGFDCAVLVCSCAGGVSHVTCQTGRGQQGRSSQWCCRNVTNIQFRSWMVHWWSSLIYHSESTLDISNH